MAVLESVARIAEAASRVTVSSRRYTFNSFTASVSCLKSHSCYDVNRSRLQTKYTHHTDRRLKPHGHSVLPEAKYVIGEVRTGEQAYRRPGGHCIMEPCDVCERTKTDPSGDKNSQSGGRVKSLD